ncbi:MAG: hypothetical protein DWQ37_08945 [Planctomycetota bacterium]|nr:MAG: hypothetical protein DWQ37_08945 [Planctomycetota bacterium]
MLDFRQRTNVPNYLGPRLQRRLLVYLAAAAVLAVGGLWATNPQRFAWISSEPPRGAVDQRTARVGATIVHEDVQEAGRRPLFPGVREDCLSEVRDGTAHRGAEKDACFHLLALLQQASPQDLEAASEEHVGYLQLDQQPASYRGHLVTVAGVVRSAKEVTAPENAFGIEKYYQLWLQPERSAPELLVIYCLELPDGFPLGTDLDAPCSSTGFFFKRWAYLAQGGIFTAPLILARTVDWKPPPPSVVEEPAEDDFGVLVVVALLLALVILGLLALRTFFTRRRPTSNAPEMHSTLAALERELESTPDEKQEPAP